MQMTRIFLLINSLSIVLFFSANAYSDKTTDAIVAKPKKIYDVEIIIFKNKSVPQGHEINLPTPSPTREENTLDLLSDPVSIENAKNEGFSSLLQKELRLLDIVKQIVRSSRYDLLSHTGWRQPGLDRTKAIPVWIKGGKVFGRGYSSIDQVEPISIEQHTEINPIQTIEQKPIKLTNVLYELEGQITVTLSRYLHTYADLVLRKPATQQNLQVRIENELEVSEIETIAGQKLLNYSLNEQRRMRSKRLHYLDHPQFGMLVLITPYIPPIVQPDEENLDKIDESPATIVDEPV